MFDSVQCDQKTAESYSLYLFFTVIHRGLKFSHHFQSVSFLCRITISYTAPLTSSSKKEQKKLIINLTLGLWTINSFDFLLQCCFFLLTQEKHWYFWAFHSIRLLLCHHHIWDEKWHHNMEKMLTAFHTVAPSGQNEAHIYLHIHAADCTSIFDFFSSTHWTGSRPVSLLGTECHQEASPGTKRYTFTVGPCTGDIKHIP